MKLKDAGVKVYRIYPNTVYKEADTYVNIRILIDNCPSQEEGEKFADKALEIVSEKVLTYESDEQFVSYEQEEGQELVITYVFKQTYITNKELDDFEDDLRKSFNEKEIMNALQSINDKKYKLYFDIVLIENTTKIDEESYKESVNDSKEDEDYYDGLSEEEEQTLSYLGEVSREIEYLDKNDSLEKVQKVYDDLEKASQLFFENLQTDEQDKEYINKFYELIKEKCPKQYNIIVKTKQVKDSPAFADENEKLFYNDLMNMFNIGIFANVNELKETYGLSLERRKQIRKEAIRSFLDREKLYNDNKSVKDSYRIEGQYYPETRYEPAEYPEVILESDYSNDDIYDDNVYSIDEKETLGTLEEIIQNEFEKISSDEDFEKASKELEIDMEEIKTYDIYKNKDYVVDNNGKNYEKNSYFLYEDIDDLFRYDAIQLRRDIYDDLSNYEPDYDQDYEDWNNERLLEKYDL